MMPSYLKCGTSEPPNSIFTDENKAREYLEFLRWPNGPVCPRCGEFERITKLKGKSHRQGLYQCNWCYDPFTVTIGTIFEKSHIQLNKWLLAFHFMTSSKKGVIASHLHRTLGVTYVTASSMVKKIREAMMYRNPEAFIILLPVRYPLIKDFKVLFPLYLMSKKRKKFYPPKRPVERVSSPPKKETPIIPSIIPPSLQPSGFLFQLKIRHPQDQL